jgi:hypothetical protein
VDPDSSAKVARLKLALGNHSTDLALAELALLRRLLHR